MYYHIMKYENEFKFYLTKSESITPLQSIGTKIGSYITETKAQSVMLKLEQGVYRLCNNCSKVYKVDNKDIKRGLGLHCSKSCDTVTKEAKRKFKTKSMGYFILKGANRFYLIEAKYSSIEAHNRFESSKAYYLFRNIREANAKKDELNNVDEVFDFINYI